MKLEEYSKLVKLIVSTDTPNVWNDLTEGQDPPWQSHIAQLHRRGFSVIDAIRYTKLMSQKLDEDIAIREMEIISSKYKENHERR